MLLLPVCSDAVTAAAATGARLRQWSRDVLLEPFNLDERLDTARGLIGPATS